MFSLKNFFLHPGTTIGGAILSAIQAVISAGAVALAQAGATPDWKPYVTAAASSLVPFIVGGLAPSLAQDFTMITSKLVPGFKPAVIGTTAGPMVTGEAIAQDPKQQILAQVEAALAQVAHEAMLAEAGKLQNFVPPAVMPPAPPA